MVDVHANRSTLEWLTAALRSATAGRARRKEFWMFMLFYFIAAVVSVVLFIVLVGASAAAFQDLIGRFATGGIILSLFTGLFFMGAIIGTGILYISQIRRFHDQNRSGWFVFLNLIPLVGWLIVLVFMILDGTQGPNRYGPDPKTFKDVDASVFA